MNRNEKIKRLNYFLSMCVDSKGQTPIGLDYRDVAKVVSERYATQDVETVKVFFRTKGSRSNNHPYTYPEELKVGTSNVISDDLLEIRTSGLGYGDMIIKDDEMSESDLLRFLNE